MDRKGIIMTMRQEGKLKGVKPSIVVLRQNLGRVFGGPYGHFVMSYKNYRLYFQRLSPFLKKLKKEDDFDIPIRMFNEYFILNKRGGYILYLYDPEGRYMEILFPTGTTDTLPFADNVFRLVKELEEEKILIKTDFKKKEEEINGSKKESN